jgi:hypothetical protein
MGLVWNYAGKMNLIIAPEIEPIPSGSLGEDIAKQHARIVLFHEHLIRRYPDQ